MADLRLVRVVLFSLLAMASVMHCSTASAQAAPAPRQPQTGQMPSIPQMITQDETSLAEARAASDSKKELLELNQLGLLNNFTGQPQKSLDYYEQALVVERAAHDRTAEAGTLTQMGPTYIRLKRPQEAFKSFGDALSIEREQGDRKAEA